MDRLSSSLAQKPAANKISTLMRTAKLAGAIHSHFGGSSDAGKTLRRNHDHSSRIGLTDCASEYLLVPVDVNKEVLRVSRNHFEA